MHDINLIIRNKKYINYSYVKKMFIFLLLYLIVYLGIYIPLQKKQALSNQLLLQKDKAEYLQRVNKEYENKYENLDKVIQKENQLVKIVKNKYKWSDVLKVIDGCIPASVHISSISYDDNVILLEGISNNNIDIIDFYSNIKNSDMFWSVKINNITGDRGKGTFSFLLKIDIASQNDKKTYKQEK